MRRLHAAPWALLLAACAASGGAGGGTDASADGAPPPPVDTGTPDGAPPPDAGDAGPVDAGPVDAGASCSCPVLPTSCTPPAPDVPTFAPGSDAYGAQLMDVIACADETLHLAMYSADWDCLVEALAARLEAAPALVLDVVVDDDECAAGAAGRGCALALLEGHPRVTIIDDQRSLLMHHKYLVADGERVWVSSGNLSRVSFCTEYNNSLVVAQPEIVAAYEAVFQRLFTEMDFSPVAVEEPVTGGIYTVSFSPETPSSEPSDWFRDIVAAIDGATTRVDAMIFALTRPEIADALGAAHARGVAVRLLVSSRFSGEAVVTGLATMGVAVRDTVVHDKVLIVDGALVVTGSANWSAAAWGNQENALFVRDADVAAAYSAEMDRVWALASP